MKTRTKYALALMFSMSLFGCQTQGQTPKEVKEAFKAKYPGENDPDWKKDKNGNYESKFKIDGIHYRADFSPSGEWVETEQSIKKKELPKAIHKILEEDYSKYEIVELEKVDHPTKGIFYDVELKKDGKKMDVEFTANGTILN